MIFMLVMGLASAYGGYQLSQLLYKMNEVSMQRADQLLAIEIDLDDAAIELGMQIQEWKDMLLRADDEALYRKHLKAFQNASVGVQDALQRTKTDMLAVGMDVTVIDQLSVEHKTLVSNYLQAQIRLSSHDIRSAHEVDKLVIGMDRDLQQHLAEVKNQIEHLALQQLNGILPGQKKRYWVIGLLGGSALLVMALLGFVFASRLHGHEVRVVEYPSAT